MRQNLLKFVLLTAVALLAAAGAEASTSVTFDATVDVSTSLSITKDGVTMTVSSGKFDDGAAYRFYKNSTLTISTASGVLESISFSPSTFTGYPLSGLVASTGNYDGTTGDWTASSNISSVSFTPSAQARASKVVVTFSDASSLDFSPTLTDGFTFWPVMDGEPAAQVTITPYSGTLAYYTLDGSEPTTSSQRVTAATTITITGTTTVKAGTYVNGAISHVVSRTYTLGKTYNGIADFLENAATGEDIRLFWSDEMNARVLHATSTQAFVRDNTGAMIIYGITTEPAFAKDQHLAGWLKGRVGTYGGVKQLNSNDHTVSTEIVIAEPVTEEDVLPVKISTVDEFDAHQNDLVTLQNVRYNKAGGNENQGVFGGSNGSAVRFYNRFYLNDFAYPYEGALVDLTGLAIPYNTQRQVAAISMDDYYTYAVNADSAFTAPAESLNGVRVRLQRDLPGGQYLPMCLPFDLYAENVNARLFAYDKMTGQDGNIVVNFKDAEHIDASDPFIMMPEADLTEIALSDAYLSMNGAGSISDNGDRMFTGVYAPMSAEVGSHVLLPDGQLLKIEPASNYGYLRTTTAYFTGSYARDEKLYLSINGEIIGQVALFGDLNSDGAVNVGDVGTLYQGILGGKSDAKFDLNNDGAVNAGDVGKLYSIILGGNANAIVQPVNDNK